MRNFLRAHIDLVRQIDQLHRDNRQVTEERDEARVERDALRAELEASGELVRVLMQSAPSDLRDLEVEP